MLPVSSLKAQEASRFGVNPWTETLISVAEFEPTTRLFREAGNWQLRLKGMIAVEELAYWGLPKQASGQFELWCAPNADSGCIRFVKIAGVRQQPIRIAARAWDTGGIYSVMVRSDNVPALFDHAIELGWWAESQPIRFQFGASDLRNVVLQGPHGINLAVYERITPDFPHFPVGRISQGFNSMRMVRDKAAARAFYEEALGFGVLFDSGREPKEPARSNFGIPLNYTPDIPRSAAALQPALPGETGRVEVMQIEGFTGDDLSNRASLPNLGIISVRYPVQDLAGYRALLEANGVSISYQAQKVAIGGIGTVDLIAVRDPDGNLTEFYGASD
jgi:catechol 2,3-dioxygenase-like lactoylglutathione lyase family enzyme